MRKRFFALLSLAVAISMLNGCSKDSFMDVSAFTDYYNRATAYEEISLESYAVNNSTYSTVMRWQEEEILLSLEASESGKIGEIRLLIPKVDSSGAEKAVTESGRLFFTDRLKEVIEAFTPFSPERCTEIINQMTLCELSSFRSEGELTLADGDYYFVYYSTQIASVFMIFNIHIHPIAATQKPESKPAFGNTAYTREENIRST